LNIKVGIRVRVRAKVKERAGVDKRDRAGDWVKDIYEQ
jgi:hypothetical protein